MGKSLLTIKNKNVIIFVKKIKNAKYLSKNIFPVDIRSNFFTNLNYIKKINRYLINKKITSVEIHNRQNMHFI